MSSGLGPSVPITPNPKRLAENKRIRDYRRDREARDPAFKARRRAATRTYRSTAAGRAAWNTYFAKLRLDPNFKLLAVLRTRLYDALAGRNKSASTMELVSCSIASLRSHLESLFRSGMTWENHGKWHVDHRRPCSSFDLSDPDQQRECFHWSNLQPLWAEDHYIKTTLDMHRVREAA
jgi:hypothetical protein